MHGIFYESRKAPTYEERLLYEEATTN